MRNLWLFWLALLASTAGFAQQKFEVKGIVADTAGLPLQGATVRLFHGQDSAQTLTDKTGAYVFHNVTASSFTITTSFSGLQTFVRNYARPANATVFMAEPVVLFPSGGELEGVVITSVRPMTVKEDTIQYNASAYKVREGAAVEEVIKKLPGVTVDKDGNVEAQGKKVARVRVNGKDFFGGDVQTATQNIPAELIENIQIIDDYGDQANLTGIKSGEPEKIININVQRNKNRGMFGTATGAVGNEERYAGNVFMNKFFDDQQISVLAAINNTNANLFNFNGGGRGGGARGGNFGNGRGGPGGSGITLSKSAGVNFRDKWGDKVSVYGSYSFSTRNTQTLSSTFSQDFNPMNIRNTQRESSSQNFNVNHRITWNMEYAIDSFNFLKISPYYSFSRSESESRSTSDIRRTKFSTLNNNFNSNVSQSPGAGGNLLYNHKFSKRGRNLSLNFNLDYSDNTADRFSNSAYTNVDSTLTPLSIRDTLQIQTTGTVNRNTRKNFRLSFTEPLNATRTTFLEFSYDWNRSSTESLRDVYDLADSVSKIATFNERQSNHYNYDFTTNRIGISIKGQKAKYNYNIGVQSQPTSLSGYSAGKVYETGYRNLNWVPTARFVYNFARNNSITATLDGAAREPAFMQLQPVADSSNLNNIVVGNGNLRNEYTNTLALRYNKFDHKAGSSLFINLSYHQTDDKIVNSRTNNVSGTGRTTTYLNTDGFYGYNGNASFTQPFANKKFSAGMSMSANYDNNISFTDGQKNKGSNWNLRPGANLRVDLDKIVDLTLRADYTMFQTTTRYTDYINTTKAQTLSLGLNGKNYFGDLTVGYDFTRAVNYGFSSSVNSNPTILNLYTEYRMLKGKMLTLKLQGFDLLNQNTGITRTVNETTITDSRNNRLARYFLLSANIRLAKFTAGGNQMKGNNRGGQWNRQ